MKKIVLFIIFLTCVIFAQAQIKGYSVEGTLYYIIGGDTIRATTQQTDSDTTLATKDYVDILSGGGFDSIVFASDISGLTWQEGKLYYDSVRNNLVFFDANSEVSLDLGKEQWIDAYNSTASTITNGQIVFVDTVNGMYPTIELAKADLPTTSDGVIGVATHDIETGTIGRVTTFGIVRDMNTSALTAGKTAYVSPTTAGSATDSRPEYPNYAIQIGQILVSDNDSGQIFVNKIGRIEDILDNGWNGSFLESFRFLVSSNGSTITGTLNEVLSTGYLTMNFSDGFTLLDVSTPPSITLTAGTDSNPQLNYVYIPKSTKVLTVSTSFWPSAEHIPVAVVALRSASATVTDGALRNQNIDDHVAGSDGQGHLSHVGKRIRKLNAEWESGTAGSATIYSASTPDSVTIAVTGGKVWQMHLQDYPAMDMATGDDIHVVNNPSNPYVTITNLSSEVLDANGVSLANKSFSFVLWGIANESTTTSHMMLNLPTGGYAKNDPDLAVNDASNYSVYSIPNIFKGVGFLIARFTFTLDAAGEVWTLYDTEDLRGKVPNNTAGGGAGGTGVIDFDQLTDTPNSKVGNAGKHLIVGDGETSLQYESPGQVISGSDTLVSGNNVYDFTTTIISDSLQIVRDSLDTKLAKRDSISSTGFVSNNAFNDSLTNYWNKQQITEADTTNWGIDTQLSDSEVATALSNVYPNFDRDSTDNVELNDSTVVFFTPTQADTMATAIRGEIQDPLTVATLLETLTGTDTSKVITPYTFVQILNLLRYNYTEIVETPSGTINGVNDTFTLANTPGSNRFVQIILCGLTMIEDVDYTISGSTITMINIPESGDVFRVRYKY